MRTSVARPPPVLIFTIGHSTRTLDELVEALRAFGVATLVDVRSIPRSRKNPQFNTECLARDLPRAGIAYVHDPALGGRRSKEEAPSAARHTAWRVDAFRSFAGYADTPPFRDALDDLIARARRSTCAIMCAEAVWWRCHRRIITDYLLVAGVRVRHIMTARHADDATMTPFARPRPDGTILYAGPPSRKARGTDEAGASSRRRSPARRRRAVAPRRRASPTSPRR
jgi:hypothetical protein